MTLRRIPTTADGQGGQATSTPVTVATVWAMVRSLTGREALQAGAAQSSQTHRVGIRHRTDVTVQIQAVRADGTVLEVLAVRDPDGRRAWLELDCVEAP